ncbi:MAG: histidinol-phosphatase [Clostridiales bacterium]|nr:histidinol-phosphatase [Clostridiales bacterium]
MKNGIYYYDPHVHTSQGSLCARSTGGEMAKKAKELGYDGIFITDHFFNANTTAPKDAPWEEKVSILTAGYKEARAVGDKIGLSVFFGFEFSHACTDLLVYGLDENWLLNNKDVDKWHMGVFFERVKKDGGFIVHAHPFRDKEWIKCMRLYPHQTDAVEVFNSSHNDDVTDLRARFYADSFGLPFTSGSDSHSVDGFMGGGVGVKERLTSVHDYIRLVRERRVQSFLSHEYPKDI